jgi:AcrR family transcriptional regulator
VAVTDESDGLRRRPVQGRSSQRIDLILDTAAALIDEAGYGALTPTLIARRAGMSGPAIYRYFADTDAVVRALAMRNLERFFVAAEEEVAEQDEWKDALAGFVEVYAGMVRHEPGFRWLGLGDGVDRHLLSATESNNRIVGREAAEFMSTRYDTWDRPDFAKHVDVIVELIVALIDRAFDGNDEGDPFYIREAKRLAVGYLDEFLTTVPADPHVPPRDFFGPTAIGDQSALSEALARGRALPDEQPPAG